MNVPVKRSYRRSGLYVSGLTPEEQVAMTAVRDDLLADCGGAENVSAARRILIDRDQADDKNRARSRGKVSDLTPLSYVVRRALKPAPSAEMPA